MPTRAITGCLAGSRNSMSLDAAAWVGRIATWLLLAIAWRGLSFAVVPKAWVAVLSAELFVLLNEQSQMAGEWVIGGVEGKGFAYALVFWAIHALVRGRWNLAWILLGPAVSLHAVVGGWAMVCVGVAWLATPRATADADSMLPGLAIGLLLAVPGIWFGIKLNQGIDFATATEAARIQVFERLPHHLQSNQFREGYVQRHALLAVVVFAAVQRHTSDAQRSASSLVRGRRNATGLDRICIGLLVAICTRLGIAVVAVLLVPHVRLYDAAGGVAGWSTVFIHASGKSAKIAARWWLAGLLLVSANDMAQQVRHIPGLSSLPEATIPRAIKTSSTKIGGKLAIGRPRILRRVPSSSRRAHRTRSNGTHAGRASPIRVAVRRPIGKTCPKTANKSSSGGNGCTKCLEPATQPEVALV